MTVSATADLREVKAVAAAEAEASVTVLRDATERAVELMREELPYRRFRKGITAEFALDQTPAQGNVVAEFFVGHGAGVGVLHLPGGESHPIALRATEAFNVLEGIETGTGVFGPKDSVVRPRAARALLIAVDVAPTGQEYITAPGGPYTVRPASEGMRPNDYPGRAAERLDGELDAVIDKSLEKSGL